MDFGPKTNGFLGLVFCKGQQLMDHLNKINNYGFFLFFPPLNSSSSFTFLSIGVYHECGPKMLMQCKYWCKSWYYACIRICNLNYVFVGSMQYLMRDPYSPSTDVKCFSMNRATTLPSSNPFELLRTTTTTTIIVIIIVVVVVVGPSLLFVFFFFFLMLIWCWLWALLAKYIGMVCMCDLTKCQIMLGLFAYVMSSSSEN